MVTLCPQLGNLLFYLRRLFTTIGTRPRDRDALCIIHEDKKILRMVCPVAFVANTILAFCGSNKKICFEDSKEAFRTARNVNIALCVVSRGRDIDIDRELPSNLLHQTQPQGLEPQGPQLEAHQ